MIITITFCHLGFETITGPEFLESIITLRASQMDPCSRIRLPVQEIWVQFLGQEDPLEKETATHSSIPAWRNP